MKRFVRLFLAQERVLLKTETRLACLDAYPVTGGQALVVHQPHVGSIAELPPQERDSLATEVATVRTLLTRNSSLDAVNLSVRISVDDSPAAGQTVLQLHRRGKQPTPGRGFNLAREGTAVVPDYTHAPFGLAVFPVIRSYQRGSWQPAWRDSRCRARLKSGRVSEKSSRLGDKI
jgi:diadenosine tetraphosphate (Ap4A) HIT family hydrolase